MMKRVACLIFLLLALGEAFAPSHHLGRVSVLYEKETSSYEETGDSSKGIVSALTDLVNLFFPEKKKEELSESHGGGVTGRETRARY